ncbi:MAG: hypothetical protein ACJA1C_001217 [Crocinitomicaceae bacterium]|jgi:hypothetical protein
MRKITFLLKRISVEIVIIFLYIFIVNNYIGNVNSNIGEADGKGYYDYLPSTFIHDDINRKDIPFQVNEKYSRIDSIQGYIEYQNFRVNKYPVGTAVLQLPFFGVALLTADLEGSNIDGYQPNFQKSIFFAALFYLFLAIFYIKKILEKYEIRRLIVIFIQLLIVLGTSVTHYANADASYSHVYSLFAISAFIYFALSYFKEPKLKSFILTCVFLGLVVLIRQVNILILLSLPFIAGSWPKFKTGFITLKRNYLWIISGFLIVASIIFIQCIFWYLQSGSFILYSYQSEGFDFSSPEIFNMLFSYKRGLFVYTPVMFIALSGVVWLLIKKNYYLLITWFLFFSILTYIFSSWWIWFYGAGYGLRVFIEYYPLFLIPFAVMLNQISFKWRVGIMALAFLTIPLNIIQTYQYKSFILHWTQMDKEKYWTVFLKTDDRYKGLVWKQKFVPENHVLIKEVSLNSITCSKNKTKVIHVVDAVNIPDYKKVTSIELYIDNLYDEQNETQLFVRVKDSRKVIEEKFRRKQLIQFADRGFNKWQTGRYNFYSEGVNLDEFKSIVLEVKPFESKCNLRNVKVRFLMRTK